jgi:von Willebrand factor type A domain-containing protein
MSKKLLVVLGALIPALAAAIEPPRAEEPRSNVDLVICLDTSNSMDGLIESAKLKLWDIVSTLAAAKPTPHLRVALYSYGNDGYTGDGWVRQDLAFTEDLDRVYEKLNALTTNGGTEYVARVVRAATQKLDWTPDDKALKMIFVAGNEEATQDPKFSAVKVAKEAVAKGIVVNAIYCGSPEDGDAPGWRNVAMAADGEFATIDQNQGTVAIVTPMDARLTELSGELNSTYIGYGHEAEEAKARQSAQDANASKVSASAGAARAVAKSGKLYTNSNWDLVDASQEKDFDLDKVKTEELPPEMQKMSPEERKAFVEKQAKRRAEIQAEINKLNVERQSYIAEEMKKQNLSEDKALDKAVKESLKKEAAKKNIEIQ